MLTIDMEPSDRLNIWLDINLPNMAVGIRQDGREKGVNVHDCPADSKRTGALLQRFTTTASGKPADSLYGDGHAAPRIAEFIRSMPERDMLLNKEFHSGPASFHAPWSSEAAA